MKIKQMTDKQLLTGIKELDKKAMAGCLLGIIDKKLVTKIKGMNFVSAYKYLRDNANFQYFDWLTDNENDKYEDIFDEIKKRELNLRGGEQKNDKRARTERNKIRHIAQNGFRCLCRSRRF